VAFIEELGRRQPVVLFWTTCTGRLRQRLMFWPIAESMWLAADSDRGTYRPRTCWPPITRFFRVKLELQGRGLCREIPMRFLARADVDSYMASVFLNISSPPELAAESISGQKATPLHG